jgi:5,10-methylenetetrahydromethanopterin reductase
MGTIEFWAMGVADPRRAGAAAARAEEAGYDGMLVVDSQNLSGDPFVALAMAASTTQRLKVGTGVTNPVTRHPAAAASAIASVHLLSRGRAVLGIGRGDSALAHLGLAPASASMLERYVRALRSYLRGEAVPFADLADLAGSTGVTGGVAPVAALGLADGPQSSRIAWLPGALAPVPVEVAATGPAVLALAARSADRVMLAVGVDPGRVESALDAVRREAAAAGRPAGDLAVGAYVTVVAHPDRDVARVMASGSVSTFARFSVMDGKVRASVDADQAGALKDLHARYDMNHHTEAGSAQAAGLGGDLIDHFAITGPAVDCTERLRELAALGIDRFAVAGPSLGSDRDTARYARECFTNEVLPALQEVA